MPSSTYAGSAAFTFQGILLLLNAAYTLLLPEAAAAASSPLAGTPIPTVHALSMMSLTIGISYLIAAYHGHRSYMIAAIPLRGLAAITLGRHAGGWTSVAAYEAAMGVMMGAALWWDGPKKSVN